MAGLKIACYNIAVWVFMGVLWSWVQFIKWLQVLPLLPPSMLPVAYGLTVVVAALVTWFFLASAAEELKSSKKD